MRTQIRVFGVMMLTLAARGGCFDASAWAQSPQKAQEVLAELTEDVELYSALSRRAGSDEMRRGAESYLAFSLFQRGQFYELAMKRPAEALRDLDQAEQLYRRLGGPQRPATDSDDRDNLAQVLFYQGLAKQDLDKHEEALAKFNEAITLYEKLTTETDMEHLETLLAWGYQKRGELALRQQSSLKDAIQDFDRAIVILTKWSKKQGYENHFQGLLKNLQSLREKAAQGSTTPAKTT